MTRFCAPSGQYRTAIQEHLQVRQPGLTGVSIYYPIKCSGHLLVPLQLPSLLCKSAPSGFSDWAKAEQINGSNVTPKNCGFQSVSTKLLNSCNNETQSRWNRCTAPHKCDKEVCQWQGDLICWENVLPPSRSNEDVLTWQVEIQFLHSLPFTNWQMTRCTNCKVSRCHLRHGEKNFRQNHLFWFISEFS